MFHVKLALATFLLALFACASACRKEASPKPADPGPQVAALQVLAPDDLQAIANFTRSAALGKAREISTAEIPRALRLPTVGVYVAVRAQGERIGETWGHADSAASAIAAALETLGPQPNADTLELFIGLEIQVLHPRRDKRRLRSNIHRGIFGLAIGSSESQELFSPTYVLASNRKNERLIELYAKRRALSAKALDELFYGFLLGPQLLIPLQSKSAAQLLERGNRYVELDEVTPQSVAAFANGMADWMSNNTHTDGRMTYLYYPSQGAEAKGRDNLIRQFMASIALIRVAKKSKHPSHMARATLNLDYNLGKYYKLEGDKGVVELRGKVKLGALALAALAIVEHPERARWSQQEAALRTSVQSLWQEDGSFRTFLRPEGRNDNQNFYPGEALLLWATLYTETKDPALLAQFMKSFRYYRQYHLDTSVAHRRNPAFIPWHTQAYYMVWRETRDPELAAFVFEMNDWLLGVQEWDEAQYPDTRGRFYDPDRPFGPPHASATGVYLEGLIDAYQLARSLGDESRAKAYQTAILRALRSGMQLQFADELDMFYVHDKKAVRGGLRTTVYDNQIRCDNVQHTLMGTLKVLDSDVLSKAP